MSYDNSTRPVVLRRFVTPRHLIFALVLLGSLAGPAEAFAAAYRPADDSQVLERLPKSGDSAQRELRRLRNKLSEDPSDLHLALRLARRYIGLGRAEADPRYNGYAQAALKPWWSLAAPPLEILVLRAVLRQSRHDFDGALADLERVLAARPNHKQAWLTRAFILQVQGRYDEARRSCAELSHPVSALVVATCFGRLDSLSGDVDAAAERLGRAIRNAPQADKRVKLWALTNLAEIESRAGRHDLAEQRFGEALALGLRDVYLLSAYSDFLLDRDRAAEVRRLLRDERRADGLLLRLAIAENRLGDPKAGEHSAALQARFAASRRRGDARHRREETRFVLELLDQPERALRLARENWQTQKEPWDLRLVLEAALAAKSPDGAEPVLSWLAKTGSEDKEVRRLVDRLKAGGS